MELTIRTAYKSHPNSNVGQVVATAAGRQATRRIDQAQSSDQNFAAAARLLADRLGIREDAKIVETDSNDSGTVRRFTVTEAQA